MFVYILRTVVYIQSDSTVQNVPVYLDRDDAIIFRELIKSTFTSGTLKLVRTRKTSLKLFFYLGKI